MVNGLSSNVTFNQCVVKDSMPALPLIIILFIVQITTSQSHSSKSSNDSFSKLSVGVEGSYGGLVSVSGGYSREDGSSSLAVEGSNLQISFKIRKVTISRPWLDLAVLHYPIVGIKGLEAGSWSNGELDAATNKGCFPLLPTAMIVAKDIVISSEKFSESFRDSMSNTSMNASVKVCYQIHFSNLLIFYFNI